MLELRRNMPTCVRVCVCMCGNCLPASREMRGEGDYRPRKGGVDCLEGGSCFLVTILRCGPSGELASGRSHIAPHSGRCRSGGRDRRARVGSGVGEQVLEWVDRLIQHVRPASGLHLQVTHTRTRYPRSPLKHTFRSPHDRILGRKLDSALNGGIVLFNGNGA